MNSHTLEVKNLYITAENKTLVNGVNLSLKSGVITALVGRSGNGKTLCANSLLGILATNLRIQAHFYHDQMLLETNFKRNRLITAVMQNPRTAFNPIWTMGATAKETLNVNGLSGDNDQGKIISTFKRVGLQNAEEVYNLYPFQMSGGMLQRAMIALALLQDTPFLVADEPTTDLDLIIQSIILDILKDIAKNNNIGILLITHDFGIVAKLADNVHVINEGKIIESANVRDIFAHPRNDHTKELLKAHLALYEG